MDEYVAEQTEEKKKRKKLKKWQKWLIGISCVPIAVFVVFFIVAIADTVQFSKETEDSTYTTKVEDNKFDFGSCESDDLKEGDITSFSVSLSDKRLEKLEEYLDNVEVEYDYEHLYNIDSVYSKYKETAVCSVEKHSGDIRVNGRIDADKLFETVKANNKKTVKESYFKEEYSDAKLMEYCEFIAKNLPVIFEKYPEIDSDMVCCLLTDLKILECTTTFSSAHVTQELVLNIDEKQMEMNNVLLQAEDAYTDTLYHELMHICHIGCKDIQSSDNEWVVGISRKYEDEIINSLMWYWLEEGLAEMNKSKCLDADVNNYKTRIGYINSVNFLLTLGFQAGVSPLETINFGHDIEKLFSLFDAKTEEDKKEVIKLMYSIEALQSEPSDFYDAYLKEYDVDLGKDEEAEEDFRMVVKSDILETFSVLFFRNLARQINNGNVTLQDVCYLMRIYEARLCNHLSNNYYGFMVDGKHLYDSYLSMQNEFLKALSADNELSFEELQSVFEEYSINITDGETTKFPNCDLNFLKKDEKQWIFDFVDSYYRKGYPSIKKCVELAKQAEESINSLDK